MAMKKVCIFCMRQHKSRRPKLCQAKGEVMRSYVDKGLQMWQIMRGIETGIIKFEAEASAIVRGKKNVRAVAKKKA